MPRCTKIPRGYRSLLYEIEIWNPSHLHILPFIPLQYWYQCHHLKYPTSPEHHHMMSDITTWCPNDVMLFLVGMYVHVPGTLSGHIQSELGCWRGCSHPPYMEWETVTPGAYHDTLPQVFWCISTSSKPGYGLLKHIKKKNNWHGMYKDWPKWMIKTWKTWV